MQKANRKVVTVACAVLIAGCAVNQPEEDPMVTQLNDIERRLAAVERILANGSLVDMAVQVDNLQRQGAELRGRSEKLEYDAQETATRQRDLYQDLDQRIQSLEQGIRASGASSGASSGALPVPGGSDRDNYQAAFELLKDQQYEQAATAFEQFLSSYPDSELADNAQYWLAESYYVTEEFDDALREFQVVIDRFERSRKVPDALLKMGYCNYEIGNWDQARAALSRVQLEFPDTTAARLAEQRLTRMTEEGR